MSQSRYLVKIVSIAFMLAGSLPFALADQPFDPRAGEPFDLQGYIDNQLRAGKKQITIPPGKYRVTPKNRAHLHLANLDHVNIVADGVEMICTETTRAITIENCNKLTLRGLSIDYDPLPFTQGEIVAISPDGLTHEIELFSGYPASSEVTGEKYEIFQPDSRTLRFGSYYGYTVTRPSPERLRVVKPDRYRQQHPERVGDIIAIGCKNAPGGSIPHAVVIEKSRQVTLLHIKLYASNCFGFLESDSHANVYRKCIVDRRPAGTDIRVRENPRIRSLNADAFHSKQANVGPSYIECKARFQGDDCVAINGDYHMIMGVKGNELRVLAKRSLNISPADPVELVSCAGVRLPDATVVSIESDGDITAVEKDFLQAQHMNNALKNNQHGSLSKAFRISLDRSVTLPMGSLICSANRTGNGFKIVDCEFGFNRSRGLLIKASKGEIRGNLLDGCWMDAIQLAPEYWWLEAGNACDVVIRDNVIKHCQNRGISVTSHGGKGQVSPAGAHYNITIKGNRIEDSPAPQIQVTSTDRLSIRNNRIHSLEVQELTLDQAIEVKNCTEVRNERNVIVSQ